jgi:hypothetical protein
MLAGMRRESSIGHNRSYTGIETITKELKRIQRNLLLNAETLMRIGNAQIQIPATQAQLIMPPPTRFTNQLLTPPEPFPVSQLIVEPSRSIPHSAPTEAMAFVASSGLSVPQYELDRTVMTVLELWEEWKFGRGLKPSIKELIAK